MEIPTVAPEKFRKGTTVKWAFDPGPDHRPADGWALTYSFANATDAKSVVATDNGDGTFLVTITATVSASFNAADYAYVATVAKAPEVYERDSGTVTVEPQLSTAVDGRSHVKKVLDAIEALIAGKAAGADVASYSIATGSGSSRALTHMTPEELVKWRQVYRAEYQRELQADRIAKGLGSRGKIRVRFTSI